MGMSVRRFVFLTDEDVLRFMEFMRANRKPMAKQGRYLVATVAEYRPSRTNEQNAFMWVALLEPAAQQVAPQGQRYTAEAWNEHAKRQFLPDINAKGMSKWMHLPDGTRELAMSTTDLNDEEMTEYLHQLEAYLVSEWGVHIPADPRRI